MLRGDHRDSFLSVPAGYRRRRDDFVDSILERDITPRFRVILRSAVAARIREGIPRASVAERSGLGLPFAGLVEVGGLMLGERVAENAFLVIDISLTVGEPRRYQYEPDEHRPVVQAFFEQFPDRSRFGMIGSWHSHPSGSPKPSARDLETLKETMAHPSTDLGFMVLLVVCLDGAGQLQAGGVVLTRDPSVLSNIDVSIGDP